MAKTKAYIRLSGDEEDHDRQRWLILKLVKDRGLGEVDFIEESFSGKKYWRERALGKAIGQLGSGDTLVVAEMSHLGSSLQEIFEILSIFLRKGVRVHAAKGARSLDPSMPVEALAMVLSMASEIERDLKGSNRRRRSGVSNNSEERRGRPKGQGRSKLDPHEDVLRMLLARGTSKQWIAEQFGFSTATFWYWIKTRGIK